MPAYIAKTKYGEVYLYCEYDYETVPQEERDSVCNGAGPRNFGWLVPDTIYGLSITEAANIHDWMYHCGAKEEDRVRADTVFLNNMIRLISAKKQWGWVKKLRLMRANKYYWAVSKFGGPAFWANK